MTNITAQKLRTYSAVAFGQVTWFHYGTGHRYGSILGYDHTEYGFHENQRQEALIHHPDGRLIHVLLGTSSRTTHKGNCVVFVFNGKVKDKLPRVAYWCFLDEYLRAERRAQPDTAIMAVA